MWRLLFVGLLFGFPPRTAAAPRTADPLSSAIARFLYGHEQLCGDQFADSDWLPALDQCELDCDLLTEVCQTTAKKVVMRTQRCLELPRRCVDEMRNFLYGFGPSASPSARVITPRALFSDQPLRNGVGIAGISNSKARLPPTSTRPPFSVDLHVTRGSSIRKAPRTHEMSSEEPFATAAVLRHFGVDQTFEDSGEESVEEKPVKSVGSFVQQQPKEEVDVEQEVEDEQETRANIVDQKTIDRFFEKNVNEGEDLGLSPVSIPTTVHQLPPPPPPPSSLAATSIDVEEPPVSTNAIFDVVDNPFERMVAQPAATISQQWPARTINEDPRLETSPAIPTPPAEVHIFGPPFVEKNRNSPPPMFGMPTRAGAPTPTVVWRDNAGPPDLDTNLLTSLGQHHNRASPWSWKELTSKLKKKPFYSLETKAEFDQSVRCCQWALDGLCDRSWQRVRTLCPRSCGTVVCSSVDGALSCNRAIDVDVIDCYERRKFRAHGFSNHRLHPTAALPLKPAATEGVDVETHWLQLNNDESPPPQFSKAPRSQSSLLQKAYAIEDEIRAFRKHRPP